MKAKHVVIQGAGICGLSAAWALHKKHGSDEKITTEHTEFTEKYFCYLPGDVGK